MILWLKAFHIVFVVTWFAGLFYLPRLFMYHAGAEDSLSIARFITMERRLFVIMTIGAALTVIFGMSMMATAPAYRTMPWLHVKLALVALLVAYHFWCYFLMRQLRERRHIRSQRWYKLFNEVPGLLLIAIVILATVKPGF